MGSIRRFFGNITSSPANSSNATSVDSNEMTNENPDFESGPQNSGIVGNSVLAAADDGNATSVDSNDLLDEDADFDGSLLNSDMGEEDFALSAADDGNASSLGSNELSDEDADFDGSPRNSDMGEEDALSPSNDSNAATGFSNASSPGIPISNRDILHDRLYWEPRRQRQSAVPKQCCEWINEALQQRCPSMHGYRNIRVRDCETFNTNKHRQFWGGYGVCDRCRKKFMSGRNIEISTIIRTWRAFKCKTHSLEDRAAHPDGLHSCTCQRKLERFYENWHCKADTIERQRPYIDEGNRIMEVELHRHAKKDPMGGWYRPRVDYRKPKRKWALAPCCWGKPWLVRGMPHQDATRVCTKCGGEDVEEQVGSDDDDDGWIDMYGKRWDLKVAEGDRSWGQNSGGAFTREEWLASGLGRR